MHYTVKCEWKNYFSLNWNTRGGVSFSYTRHLFSKTTFVFKYAAIYSLVEIFLRGSIDKETRVLVLGFTVTSAEATAWWSGRWDCSGRDSKCRCTLFTPNAQVTRELQHKHQTETGCESEKHFFYSSIVFHAHLQQVSGNYFMLDLVLHPIENDLESSNSMVK